MRPLERPFPRRVRITGDPVSRAFYGWRLAGRTEGARRIAITLPGPMPTGPVWAAVRRPGGLEWQVPRQVRRGERVSCLLPAGTCLIGAGPVAPEPRRATAPAWAPPDAVAGPVVVIAGQHPGEDPAIRVAGDIARVLERRLDLPGRVVVLPIVNATGRCAGHTRETADGLDPNRSWHLDGIAELAGLRPLLAGARFVVDLHGDEFARRPYTVGPVVAGRPEIAAAAETFADRFRRACPDVGSRPKAPGAGEDDPGILVNWLASRGVPGVMVELPMRLCRSPARACFRSVRTAERRAAAALVAAIAGTLQADATTETDR